MAKTGVEKLIPEDLGVEQMLITDLKSVMQEHGCVPDNWTVKENKNGRSITITGSRVPWEEPEQPPPFEKPGESE